MAVSGKTAMGSTEAIQKVTAVYVILAPDNTVLATHAGIVPTPAKFLAWLDHGTRLTALVEKSAK